MTSPQLAARYGGTRGTGERKEFSLSLAAREQKKAAKSTSGVLKFSPEQVFEITDLLTQKIQLARQSLNIGRSTAIDIEIEFAAQAVFGILPVLAHHDDWRLNGSEHGEEQVQQNKRIGVPSGSA